MRKNGFLCVMVLFGLALAQCRRDKDIFIATEKTETQYTDTTWLDSVALLRYPAVPDIDQLTMVWRTPLSIDSFPAESGATVVASDNTIIEIPPLSFQYSNGETVRGMVSLEHLVLLNKGGFLFNDRYTLFQGRPTNMYGQVYIGAQKGSERLLVARNKAITVRFRANNADPMAQLWEGNTTMRTAVEWRPAPIFVNGRVRLQTWVNPRDSTRGYAFDTDRMGWTGVGRLATDSLPVVSRVAVALPPRFTNLNTAVFIVHREEAVFFRLWAQPSSKQFVLPPSLRGLTLGKTLDLIAVSKIGSEHFFVKREWQVTNNGPDVHVLQPQPMPLADIRAILSRL